MLYDVTAKLIILLKMVLANFTHLFFSDELENGIVIGIGINF